MSNFDLLLLYKNRVYWKSKNTFSFIKAIEVPDAGLSRFLGRGSLTKYKKLLNKFIDQDSFIQLATITRLKLGQDGAFNFLYYLVVFSEELIPVLRQNSAKLKKE